MHMNRKTGVLLPLSSLPGTHGIGDCGEHAYQWIDLLHENGVKIWQILPLNPLGYGNSPYQSCSSFAGDEIYISLPMLVKEGLLPQKYSRKKGKQNDRVDYPTVKKTKREALQKACRIFYHKKLDQRQDYQDFLKLAFWLPHYALFMAIRAQYGDVCWVDWQREDRDALLDQNYDQSMLETEKRYHYFVQYLFFRQWRQLKRYAEEKGVSIMGDIPIYLGLDSADVWEHRSYFLLDKKGRPRFVAGVPPDYFSAQGQRWGNPIYNWKALKKHHYDFWIDRLYWNQMLYHIIRIDHFRAFDDYWKIPASCQTAIEGKWELGPRHDFFRNVFQQLHDIQIVVEDLGILRKQAQKLRDDFHLMGMKIIQFDLDNTADSFLKEDKKHLLIYTGTHDNEPIRSWYEALAPSLQKHTRNMLNRLQIKERCISRGLIRFTLASHADAAIIPAWDLLHLGKNARFNVPATIGSPNWEWRLTTLSKIENELKWLHEWILFYKR